MRNWQKIMASAWAALILAPVALTLGAYVWAAFTGEVLPNAPLMMGLTATLTVLLVVFLARVWMPKSRAMTPKPNG